MSFLRDANLEISKKTSNNLVILIQYRTKKVIEAISSNDAKECLYRLAKLSMMSNDIYVHRFALAEDLDEVREYSDAMDIFSENVREVASASLLFLEEKYKSFVTKEKLQQFIDYASKNKITRKTIKKQLKLIIPTAAPIKKRGVR